MKHHVKKGSLTSTSEVITEEVHIVVHCKNKCIHLHPQLHMDCINVLRRNTVCTAIVDATEKKIQAEVRTQVKAHELHTYLLHSQESTQSVMCITPTG